MGRGELRYLTGRMGPVDSGPEEYFGLLSKKLERFPGLLTHWGFWPIGRRVLARVTRIGLLFGTAQLMRTGGTQNRQLEYSVGNYLRIQGPLQPQILGQPRLVTLEANSDQ